MAQIIKKLSMLCVIWISFAVYAQEVPQDIVTIKDNSISLQNQKGQIHLDFDIEVKEGFFAYQDKFEVNLKDFNTLRLDLNPIVSFFDQTFQKTKHGVKNTAHVETVLSFAGKTPPSKIELQLVYQACTEEYCLFPTHVNAEHLLTSDETSAIKNSITPHWLQKGLLLSLLFVFGAGFLTSLTPCVYPMLPITLVILGTNKSHSKLIGFSRSFTYVLGMSLTYSMLGLLAATTGFMFGSLLSNSYFLIFLSLILFVGALSMFDIFEIQTPRFLRDRLNTQSQSTSYVALFLTGLFSGLIVGPCVGPVLVGVLGYVSQTGSLFLGFSLLFAFSMGLGSLILVLGTFSNLFDKIPRSGSWMILIKKLLGLAFLALIIYFIRPILSSRDVTLVTFIIIFSFAFILSIKSFKAEDTSLFEKSIYRTTLIFSFVLVIITLSMSDERFERLFGYSSETFANTHWDTFSEEKLELAKEHGQFVVLDFYADWCAACRELKHITFADPRVSQFSNKIKWMYFDSTKQSKILDQLKTKYNIVGLPTILFFDSKGVLHTDLTLTGFEKPDQFLQRLNNLMNVAK